MDLQPTEEQQALAQVLHDFAASEIRAAARACEEAGEVAEPIRKARSPRSSSPRSWPGAIRGSPTAFWPPVWPRA